MAEIIAIIGGVAACLQLAEGFMKLSKKLNRQIRMMEYAPKQLTEIKEDTFLMSQCLFLIEEAGVAALRTIDPSSPNANSMHRAVRIVTEQGEKLTVGIMKLIKKLRAPIYVPALQILIERVRWFIEESKLEILQGVLKNVKLNATMVASTMQLMLAHETLQKLIKENEEVPEDLRRKVKFLEKQLAQQKAIAKDALQRLRVQVGSANRDEDLVEGVNELITASRELVGLVRRTHSDVTSTSRAQRRSATTSRSSASRRLRRSTASNSVRVPITLPTPSSPLPDAPGMLAPQSQSMHESSYTELPRSLESIHEPEENPLKGATVMESEVPTPSRATDQRTIDWAVIDDGRNPLRVEQKEWRTSNQGLSENEDGNEHDHDLPTQTVSSVPNPMAGTGCPEPCAENDRDDASSSKGSSQRKGKPKIISCQCDKCKKISDITISTPQIQKRQGPPSAANFVSSPQSTHSGQRRSVDMFSGNRPRENGGTQDDRKLDGRKPKAPFAKEDERGRRKSASSSEE